MLYMVELSRSPTHKNATKLRLGYSDRIHSPQTSGGVVSKGERVQVARRLAPRHESAVHSALAANPRTVEASSYRKFQSMVKRDRGRAVLVAWARGAQLLTIAQSPVL
jgi:hypothetical protein